MKEEFQAIPYIIRFRIWFSPWGLKVMIEITIRIIINDLNRWKQSERTVGVFRLKNVFLRPYFGFPLMYLLRQLILPSQNLGLLNLVNIEVE